MINKSVRLKEFREKTGKTGTEIANQLQISQGNYSAMEGGTRPIGKKMVSKILSVFNINPTWWETGEGEMNMPEEPIKEKQSQDKLTTNLIAERLLITQQQLIETQQELIKTQAELLKERRKQDIKSKKNGPTNK